MDGEMRSVKKMLGNFLGADSQNLVLVPNATSGVNAVLRSLAFTAGDEILVHSHIYGACSNVVAFVAKSKGVSIRTALIPFPCDSAERIHDAVMAQVTSRTRLVFLDHITSPSALTFPLQTLIPELQKRHIEVFIDGAHAPGQIPLALEQLGATYYVGNCHKWMCAPRGTGFLYVAPHRQDLVFPAVISPQADTVRAGRSAFEQRFEWAGTQDYTPFLMIPETVEYLKTSWPGGWDALMQRNHQLVLQGRDLICHALECPRPAPDSLLGAMATVPLPERFSRHAITLMSQAAAMNDGLASPAMLTEPRWALYRDLLDRFGIDVSIHDFGGDGKLALRISAHAYNTLEEYQTLAEALRTF